MIKVKCDWCENKYINEKYLKDEGMYCFHCTSKMRSGERPPIPKRWTFDRIIANYS